MQQVKFRVINPDGTGSDGVFSFKSEEPTYQEIAALLKPYFGDQLERVRVFWPNSYTDMFVHEMGHVIGLAFNEEATRIYHNNLKVHDPAEFEAAKPHPTIVGIAVLFDRQIWQ